MKREREREREAMKQLSQRKKTREKYKQSNIKNDRITVSLKIKKIETYISRKMQIWRNNSKEITEMGNKESVTKGGRAVAILK